MAEISFDSTVIQNQINTIQKEQQALDSLLQDAQSALAKASDWTGTSAQTYRGTFQAMISKMNSEKTVITQYITFLQQAVADYEAQENATQQDVASFENGD